MNAVNERVEMAKRDYPGLKVYWGTGYPIDRPHILAIDRGSWSRVTVYPQGDNGLSGMNMGRPEVNY